MSSERDPRNGVSTNYLNASRAPLGLCAGVGIDISFLPLDAPVAQLVQRDARSSDGAYHMVPVRQDAEGPRKVVQARRASGSTHQHNLFLRLVEQPPLRCDIGCAARTLNPRRRVGSWRLACAGRCVHRSIPEVQLQIACDLRIGGMGQRPALAIGHSRETPLQRPVGMSELREPPKGRETCALATLSDNSSPLSRGATELRSARA